MEMGNPRTVNEYEIIFAVPGQDQPASRRITAGSIKFNSRYRVAFIFRDGDFVALFTNVITILSVSEKGADSCQ